MQSNVNNVSAEIIKSYGDNFDRLSATNLSHLHDNTYEITLYRPGLLIGRRGSTFDAILTHCRSIFGDDFGLTIHEAKQNEHRLFVFDLNKNKIYDGGFIYTSFIHDQPEIKGHILFNLINQITHSTFATTGINIYKETKNYMLIYAKTKDDAIRKYKDVTFTRVLNLI